MKKIIFIIVIVVLLIIINNLAHSIYDIWQKKDLVTKAENELNFQKQENNKLKSEVAYVQTPEFIEKEARDKLFMVKKGEQRVLIPQEPVKKEEIQKNSLPNWKQWWELFF